MKKSILFSSFLVLSVLLSARTTTDLSKKVNPFIGTDFTGTCYPGATVPFGMVQLSPDNGTSGWYRIPGYYYPDSTIAGFSHTHLSGTGAGDLYDISFFPVTMPYREAKGELGIYSRFSHLHESAQAGYYKVLLSDYNIGVELTATDRCGIQRYTFPKAQSAVFLNLSKALNWDFTADSHIEVVDSVTVRGYRFSRGWANDQRVYFVTKFSKPFRKFSTVTNDVKSNHGFTTSGKGVVARFDYTTTEGEQLIIRTALSAVDYEGAMKNLQQEAPHADFDKYLRQAKDNWNCQLSKVQVKMAHPDQEVSFYTAMYRSMLAPTLYSDVDGRYRGADQKVHQADGWNNYTTFSLWDTYRAAHPLYVLLHPSRVSDMVNSLIHFADENGRLPVWTLMGNETDMMIGYHSASVIAEAYAKGIRGFNAVKALELCVKTANLDAYRGLGAYKKNGFIPYDQEGESVSKTLEYAYDDYTIGVLASLLNKPKVAAEFQKRSEYYKNCYNPQSGFMQPRDSKGVFIPDFDPKAYTKHITESNAWHYLWSVQQNIPGLVNLIGGTEAFERKLDTLFAYKPAPGDSLPIFSTGMIGQYAHGNEPSHHVAYLFNYTKSAYKTQFFCHQIMADFYQNKPGGLCGNDDCGQMSAWYIFSALGFYPVNPVSGTYQIGSPLVDHATIRLNSKILTIDVKRPSAKAIYIKDVRLNGKQLRRSFLTHTELVNGGTLLFEMSDTPCQNWF